MKVPLSKTELLLLALLAVGVLFTYKDFRAWRNIEFGHYGQGVVNQMPVAPAMALDNRYQNVLVHVRMSYPTDWKAVENPVTANPKKAPIITKKIEIVHFTTPDGVVSLTAEKIDRNMVDVVNSLVKKITPARDREYISTDRANFTIVTWIVGETTHQAAYMTPDDKIMFTIEATTLTSAWPAYEKTFWQMYSSLIPL